MPTYRDAFSHCPRCRVPMITAGSVLGCEGCGGVWVEEGVLDEMVREMQDGFGELRFGSRERDREVTCPACRVVLDNVTMEGVPVERCPSNHGVWFDAAELEAALHAVATGEPAITEEVPNVRIGFWRALLGAIGGTAGLLGDGLAGATVLAVGISSASTSGAEPD